MNVIYEPKGKAREYAPLAANLYRGCGHGCGYCYGPSATFKKRSDFHEDVKPRDNVLEHLEKNARKLRGDERPVLMSFTTDPYQPIDSMTCLTRSAIEILNMYDLKCQILTKGGLRAVRDFDLLCKHPDNEFAVTLTTDDHEESNAWEPNAALPDERIESLRIAKEYGIRTWVSMEPVINPEAVYRLIDVTHPYVDLYKVGKLNYHPLAKTIDWVEFRENVIHQLDKLNKPYLIKKDLQEVV